MNYLYLAQIGTNYAKEVGTSGHREDFLNSCAAGLRGAQLQLAQARSAADALKLPFVGTVAQRTAAYQNKEAAEAAAKQAIAVAEQKVIWNKRKITRMGAVVNPATNTIDWGQSTRVVAYDGTLAAQDLTKLHFKNGKLFSDAECTAPSDTRRMVTANMGPGFCIYVMSGNGNIHVSNHSVGDRHHSSLLAGGNVAGAGEMKVISGTLTWISNKSGHYIPEAKQLLQTLHSLGKKGVDLANVGLNLLAAGNGKKGVRYANVGAFLAAMQAIGEPDFEYAKLLAVIQTDYLQVADFILLLGTTGWRWVTDPERVAGKRGVVTTVGVAVPHRDVRRWIKTTRGVVPKPILNAAHP